MQSCINCGNPIDISNPQEVFYTVKPNIYACGECHNADLNVGYDEEMKKPINMVEVFAIGVTVATLIAIFYLIYG